MESTYRKAVNLRANFLERYFENDSIVRVESGTAYFCGCKHSGNGVLCDGTHKGL